MYIPTLHMSLVFKNIDRGMQGVGPTYVQDDLFFVKL
jgi:hypothetical protein